MSDYYNFPPSRPGSGSNPGPYQQATILSGSSSSTPNLGENIKSDTSQSALYYSGLSEHLIDYQTPKSSSSRHRRKSAPTPDHIKHRRTRSGCFTCRSRRVKCDEARPTCERCRKGKRDCVYPDPTPLSKSASSQDAKNVGPSEEEEDTDDSGLTPIPDEDYEIPVNTSQQPTQPKRSLRRINTSSSLSLKQRMINRTRQSSETPSLDDFQSPSPIVSNCTSVTSTPTSASIPDLLSTAEPDWSHLPIDLRAALDYFKANITHWSYGVHKDFSNFFQTTFLNLALRHEALLNAVVGFSAYQRTIRDPNGKIEDFLKYYTHAVTLLLGFLKKRDGQHDLATLLTIFQLATIEEYFGDWVNLMGHQKAALAIFKNLFQADTIPQTPVGRILLVWYLRFDIFVASMGSIEPSLPRQWEENLSAQCQAQLSIDPQNLEWLCENAESHLRLLSMDMCCITSRRKTGELTEEEFGVEHSRLSLRLKSWREHLDPMLTDPSRRFKPLTQSDQTRLFHYFPDGAPLYEGPLAHTTVLLTEWHSMILMHMTQISNDLLANASAILGDMAQHAEAICQIIEAAEQWTTIPSGLLTMLHPSLAIAAMYLMKSPRRYAWLREKLSYLEHCGYIFPAPFRARMTQLFEDETIMRWWLPNDRGFTPILQSVRAFADERNRSDASRQREHRTAMEEVFDAVVDLRLHDTTVDRSRGE
ncbi:hypothetical protein M406DRAFT_252114 [Cryphonectria parasitica EP155]|uniref:Zn(2)-C6 fungal-type domain-containing protein n=1 Tax=Cryphonectria parasitica (strain ATCC 38755 / EP155) TaxID=660469 RepID=A0A9P4Y6Q1_CRYP1|nr:uncharacterized protein M406DRAFT_252114 [Cryphonectria parasitica EP155]KAF3767367.1 hypothetical protein M406DRAFT_252114 [Cryphonectria parasitica EP155]